MGIDTAGNGLAIWPLVRAGASETGGDLHLLHYVTYDPATETWSPEAPVPGYVPATQSVFADQNPNPRYERVVGGAGGILVAWRQFSGPDLFLNLALFRGGSWLDLVQIPFFSNGADPTTGTTTINEVILDAIATPNGFIVLTGRTIRSAGGVSDYWVRRLTYDGISWQDEGEIAHEGIIPAPGGAIDTHHVIDTATQNGGQTAIQLREFAQVGEIPGIRIVDAAGTTVAYTLPNTVPETTAPGSNPVPDLRFKTLQACGDRFVAIAIATWPGHGDSVWGIDVSPTGSGPLTMIGNWREQFYDVESAGNAQGCLTVFRRSITGGSAYSVEGKVFRSGAWEATKYLQYVRSGGSLEVRANANGFATLYSAPVLGNTFAYYVVQEQNGTWSILSPTGTYVEGVYLFDASPLTRDTSYTPQPQLVPFSPNQFAVTWVDRDGTPRVMLSQSLSGWSEQTFGATKDMARQAGSAGFSGRLYMAWTSPWTTSQGGMVTGIATNWIYSDLVRRPTAPAAKLGITADSLNREALTTWYQPQYMHHFSRVYKNDAWTDSAPTFRDAEGPFTRYIHDGIRSSVVYRIGITRPVVRTIDLPIQRSPSFPGGDWSELTTIARPLYIFNLETAGANGRMVVAWEALDGIFYCVRQDAGWGCDPTPLIDGVFPTSLGANLIAGPNGFGMLTDGKESKANTTFATIFERGAWGPSKELGVNSGWVMAAGTSTYAAATAAGKRVEIRHYIDGVWQVPLVVGPMSDTVRNVQLFPRAGGGYALFFQVGTGTTHTWSSLYYDGGWSPPVDLGPGKLAAAAARPEGLLAVLDSYDQSFNQVYILKHVEDGQLIPIPQGGIWDTLKILPQVKVGPYSDAVLARSGDMLYGLRVWPGSGGTWDEPIPLNVGNGMPVTDARLALAGANFTASWLQADPSDPALPQVWAAGFSGITSP
ncbi:MAG: hypothetical protein OEY97_11435 [Nitrospirota bacterium]|nr:hypothetical protein [Nitrospirota bacterium]